MHRGNEKNRAERIARRRKNALKISSISVLSKTGTLGREKSKQERKAERGRGKAKRHQVNFSGASAINKSTRKKKKTWGKEML